MELVQVVKYETEIGNSKDISPELILEMLCNIRTAIGRVDGSFAGVDLTRVLEVVETGIYEVNGSVSTRIDLSSAKGVINTYRRHSEGGCQSCVNRGRETIDAYDATSGWYCRVSDPDYNANAIGDRPRFRVSGFSPKISRHYHNPCEDWKPCFSSTIKDLIAGEKNQISPPQSP